MCLPAWPSRRWTSRWLALVSAIDTGDNTLKLTKNDDKDWKASFAYTRPAPDRLVLDGEIDGHKEKMELQLVDRSKFLLVSRGFHWIQEYPFNR